MVFVYHAFSLSFLEILIPLFLVAVPFLFRAKVVLRFSGKDILTGIGVSAALLLPFCFFVLLMGKSVVLPPAGTVLFQLAGVALPEEVYFRGFLQERLGNTAGAVVAVSALFAFTHLPQLIFYSDISSVLTFFPSLVMGFLYMKTANVLTPAIFHFSANIVFLSLL
jgi:membrane protease YdiL (CAAX protease family)